MLKSATLVILILGQGNYSYRIGLHMLIIATAAASVAGVEQSDEEPLQSSSSSLVSHMVGSIIGACGIITMVILFFCCLAYCCVHRDRGRKADSQTFKQP